MVSRWWFLWLQKEVYIKTTQLLSWSQLRVSNSSYGYLDKQQFWHVLFACGSTTQDGDAQNAQVSVSSFSFHVLPGKPKADRADQGLYITHRLCQNVCWSGLQRGLQMRNNCSNSLSNMLYVRFDNWMCRSVSAMSCQLVCACTEMSWSAGIVAEINTN